MMTRRILAKLDILDMQAKILLDRQAKKNRLQNEERGKTLVIPLTFDFPLEFEEAISAPTAKTASKVTADKSCDTKKAKKFVPLKCEPEPIKSDFEKFNLGPPMALSNIKNPEIQPENKTSKSLDSTGHLEDSGNSRRKCPPPVNNLSTEENQSATDDRLSQCCLARKKSLPPLCFEDELKNPDAKVIHVSPARSTPPQEEQNDRSPIIFHDTQYIQTLLLTKNSFSACILENEKMYPCKKTNFVLERNCTILKSLIDDESITLSKPQKTTPTTRRKDVQARSYEMGHRTVKSKLKKKTKTQTLENRSWSTLHNSSQTFSSLTITAVDHLDKIVTQERSRTDVKFGRVLSMVKPRSPHKLSALPLKSYSTLLKNTLDVRKLNNATPLDDLLHLPKEN
ncbi:uncharacterized protein C1orf141 homolog isoform X2 [Fukomys damarensis]|nr:uncharacterized protein C1orf141 homolog isoform X2 [Fukomys damarensis]